MAFKRDFFTIDEVADDLKIDRRELIERGKQNFLPIYAFLENITALPGEYAALTDLWRGKGPDEMAMPSWFRECYAKIKFSDLPAMYGTREDYDAFPVASFGIFGKDSIFCPADFKDGGWPLNPAKLVIHLKQLMLHVADIAKLRAELKQTPPASTDLEFGNDRVKGVPKTSKFLTEHFGKGYGESNIKNWLGKGTIGTEIKTFKALFDEKNSAKKQDLYDWGKRREAKKKRKK